jgi:hypothetical protein
LKVSLFGPLVIAAFLSACGAGSGGAVQSAGTTAPPPRRVIVRRPVHAPPPAAQVQALPGIVGVIGMDRGALTRQFGTARLDVWEGDARKLQFVGTACVLDIYLYPPQAGQEPVATYVDARRVSDGQDVDRASCIAALRQR